MKSSVVVKPKNSFEPVQLEYKTSPWTTFHIWPNYNCNKIQSLVLLKSKDLSSGKQQFPHIC